MHYDESKTLLFLMKHSKLTQYIYRADPMFSVLKLTGPEQPFTLQVYSTLVLASFNKHFLYTRQVSSFVIRCTSSSSLILMIPDPVSSCMSCPSSKSAASVSSGPNSCSSRVTSAKSNMLFGLKTSNTNVFWA